MKIVAIMMFRIGTPTNVHINCLPQIVPSSHKSKYRWMKLLQSNKLKLPTKFYYFKQKLNLHKSHKSKS